MPAQLIYTSAKRGLDFGRSGYCTVARTSGMRRSLVSELESMSSYDFSKKSVEAVYTYRILNLQSETYFVCSRIAKCGFDYTGRTNFIAHHVVFDSSEVSEYRNPAHFAAKWKGWLDSWSGSSRELDKSDFAPFKGASSGGLWGKYSRSENARFLRSDGKYIFINTSCADFLELLSESFDCDSSEAWGYTFSTRLQEGESAGQYALILDELSELDAGGRLVVNPRDFKLELPPKAASGAVGKFSKPKTEPLKKRGTVGELRRKQQAEEDSGGALYEYRFAIYAASALLSIAALFVIFKCFYFSDDLESASGKHKKEGEIAALVVRDEGSGGSASSGLLEIEQAEDTDSKTDSDDSKISLSDELPLPLQERAKEGGETSDNLRDAAAEGFAESGEKSEGDAAEKAKLAESAKASQKRVSEFAESIREFFALPESFAGCEKFYAVIYESHGDGGSNRIPSRLYKFLKDSGKSLCLKAASTDLRLVPQSDPKRLMHSDKVVFDWSPDGVQNSVFKNSDTPFAAVLESGGKSFSALIFSGKSEFAYKLDLEKVFDVSLGLREDVKKILKEGVILPGDGEYACNFEIICGDAFYKAIFEKYRDESGYKLAEINSVLQRAKEKIGSLDELDSSIQKFQKILAEKYSEANAEKIKGIGDYLKFENSKFDKALNETFKSEISVGTMYSDNDLKAAANEMDAESRNIRNSLSVLSKKLKDKIEELNADKPNEFCAEFVKLKQEIDENLKKLAECDKRFCETISAQPNSSLEFVFSKTISQTRKSIDGMDWAIKKYTVLKGYEAKALILNRELFEEFGISDGDGLTKRPEIVSADEFLKGKRAGLRIYKNKKKSKGN